MICLDQGLLEQARQLAERMAREGIDRGTIDVAENAKLVVVRQKEQLAIVLATVQTNEGVTFYVGLGETN